jgi:ubiquinone/menaquinone biosynthesis C-methylase UbiE
LFTAMSSGCTAARGTSRVERSKAEAAETYDRLSTVYEILSAGAEWKYTSIGLRALDVRGGDSVLEIGSGPGKALTYLADAVGPGGTVYGIDISKGMIKRARERIREAHLEAEVDMISGDGSRIPLRSESIDAVFMSFVLELFDSPELPVVVDEAQRVLRRGGRMCVVALSSEGKDGVARRMYEWAHTRFPRYADCRPIQVADLVRCSGFDVTLSELHSMWGLPVGVVLGKKTATSA